MATVAEALAVALDHHLAGRHGEAGILYGRILDADPQNPDALHLLGVLTAQTGRPADAVGLIARAVAARPGVADFRINLAGALTAAGRPAEAEAAMAGVLLADPAHGTALTERGLAAMRRGDAAAAAVWLDRAVAVRPDDAAARINGGVAHRQAGRLRTAVARGHAAAALVPDAGPALYVNLSGALKALGRPTDAADAARRAVRLAPAESAGWVNLALALEALDRMDAADAAGRRALALEPAAPDAWTNHAPVLRRRGRIAAAVTAADRALAIAPGTADALLNRAVALQDAGRIAAAVADYRHALALAPGRADIHSNLLLALQYDPATDGAALVAEHRAWDARHGRRIPPPAPHPNPPDADRRLRIGYVSADFGFHPVGYFLAPVLPAHDRAAVEVVCYSARVREDAMTARLRAAADLWRPIAGMDDGEAEALIRSDGIDILVDLAGHTAGNRLPLFARRPAPVQATWAGYVGTTGLAAMDWLIADARHLPPGREAEVVERVARLPDGYVCVLPRPDAPPVGPLPLRANGFVTFGCFNNRAKLSEPTLALWARLLERVPGARLLLKTHQFDDPAVGDALRAIFARHGGDAGRLDLSGSAPHAAMPGWYNRVDVALDPFPYSGGLTTLEALWMGVPVVTAGGGERFCSRHSAGHLHAAGLPELVARDAEAYLAIAAGLAADPEGLAVLRANLRPRLAASPVCDGVRFTRNLEAALRMMWREWCADRDATTAV
ncbi:tetratricopeptide repeat protein [Azospirillum halopraeferens]|uniref:tetratricopeptide repeat protein n=1 Tax=Azospirillum halopraeferens TaxID=34010 RepID=UPI000401F2E3|nr:glycosyltransferase family 41 protein [Azospirillum halopraeferens]